MKLLELFKGTGSVGKVFKELYPDGEVVSVDILKKYKPTHCGDIMEFDYKQYPTGHFDIIWASPECKVFSILQHTWLKTPKTEKTGRYKWESHEHLNQVRLENGKYSKKALEIIDYFKPTMWFIENPWASAMKKLEHFKGVSSYRFDYCRFGYDYQKPTRIWSNKKLDDVICSCEQRHNFRLGINSQQLLHRTSFQDTTSINQRYSIPPQLIEHLLT